jgi:soluble epoxide hydrolase/lipid-phosphate phosphatase
MASSCHRELFTSSNGNKYSYVYNPADQSGKITLLFLHGFPSTLQDWLPQIDHFSSKGYGVVALDLLGYGSSSKPSDVQKYRLKPMGDEVVELLDHLGLHQVVGIGHDFGATLLSRMAAYHPERWTALVFLAVGPPKLGTPFDVDMINQMTKEALGFELLGYIPWLASDATQATLEQHAEAAMSLMFCRDHAAWDQWFHPLEKMKQFVSEDRRLLVGSWYTKDLQRKHLEAFGQQDGYKGVTRWYRMWKENLFAPEEVGFQDFRISQPTLFVVPREPEASAVQQEQMLAAWTPGLKTVKVDSGHWVHLEKPLETNAAIEEFLSAS